MTDFTEEEWEIIIRSRERLRWIDTLPDPQRQWAIAGVPEEDWPQLTDFVSDAGHTERKDGEGMGPEPQVHGVSAAGGTLGDTSPKVIDRLAVPARDVEAQEPCLYCGTIAYLLPARVGGHRIACADCSTVERPHAIGASRERKLDDIDLDERGIDVKSYRSRNR